MKLHSLHTLFTKYCTILLCHLKLNIRSTKVSDCWVVEIQLHFIVSAF